MQAITAIGITPKALVCEGNDLNTSESGLFLDGLPGLGADWFAPDNNYGLCADSTSYLSRMVSARKEALSLVKEAVSKALKATHVRKESNFTGYIGQRQGIGAASSTTFAIKTEDHEDAHLHVTHIGVVASGEGTAAITLAYPEAETQTFHILIDKNGYTGITADFKLPLDGTVYEFGVTTTGTVKLQNNNVGCGCGTKDTILYSYANFSQPYAAGISLTAKIGCDINTFLTRTAGSDTDIQSVLARMLYYRSGVVLCDYIMGNIQPDETDTHLDYIKQKRANLMEEFTERLVWLIESGISVKSSSCFVCTGPRIVSLG